MMFFNKLGMASLMLASSSLFAAEPAMGWYAGFMLGPSYAPSTDFTVQNLNFPATAVNVSYRVLGNFGGQLGYRCNKFRFEGELMYNRNSMKDFSIGGISLNTGPNFKGYTAEIAGLFNAYYEFYDEDYAETSFVPYVGLGIGYANVKNSITFGPFTASESANAPAGQAILGFSYFLSDTVSLGSDLRYLKTNNISNFGGSVSVASWNFVMNFSFDSPY